MKQRLTMQIHVDGGWHVTGAPELAAAVRDALVEKADLVGQIPDVAGQYEVPEEVVSRACRRAGEIAGMLRALAGGR